MASVIEPRVRETSETIGTGDIVLGGAMRGSLAFSDVMVTGDTCDICISYNNSFEECLVTLQSDGSFLRGTVYRALHSSGTVDQNHVSFDVGVKTVIMTVGSTKLSAITGAVRYDIVQALTTPQKRQALDNLGLLPTGTKLLFLGLTVPAGWTLDTTHNDKALRIVNTTGGGVGGSSPFSTVFGKTSTDNFTLLQTHLPTVNFTVDIPSGQGNHDHDISPDAAQTAGTNLQGSSALGSFASGGAARTVANTLPAMSGTAASGGSSTAHAHAMDIRVQRVDAIIGTKD